MLLLFQMECKFKNPGPLKTHHISSILFFLHFFNLSEIGAHHTINKLRAKF